MSTAFFPCLISDQFPKSPANVYYKRSSFPSCLCECVCVFTWVKCELACIHECCTLLRSFVQRYVFTVLILKLRQGYRFGFQHTFLNSTFVCSSAIVTDSLSGLLLCLSLFVCFYAAMLYILNSITQSCTHLSDVPHCLFTLLSAMLLSRRDVAVGPCVMFMSICGHVFPLSLSATLSLSLFLPACLVFLLDLLPFLLSLWC